MPHFVIDCSKTILNNQSEKEVILEIHNVAVASGLFSVNDIKVRMRPFETYLMGGKHNTEFIHVFADIMEGRNEQQKKDLSQAIVTKLKSIFPDVPFIAMNVREFEKATYTNLKNC